MGRYSQSNVARQRPRFPLPRVRAFRYAWASKNANALRTQAVVRTMVTLLPTSATAMGLEMVLNYSRCRDVIRGSDSHVAALLTDTTTHNADTAFWTDR
jgi:hypothetical protein